MNNKYLGSCSQFRKFMNISDKVHCCSSCHGDDEDGYGYLLEIEIPLKGYFEVCCTLSMCME